jgi:RNA polymerase sigma-70 factor (ECF subfamily)
MRQLRLLNPTRRDRLRRSLIHPARKHSLPDLTPVRPTLTLALELPAGSAHASAALRAHAIQNAGHDFSTCLSAPLLTNRIRTSRRNDHSTIGRRRCISCSKAAKRSEQRKVKVRLVMNTTPQVELASFGGSGVEMENARRVEMPTLVSTAGRTCSCRRPRPTAQATHTAENARLNRSPAVWKRACILIPRTGGKNHMEATAAYIGNEQCLDVAARENGTREAQDVFSRYLPLLHRTAYRYLANAADAEDAVQDALLSAHKHQDQFRGHAEMSTWLVAIVSNCARMQLRRRPRQIHVSLNEQFGEEQGYTVSERLVDCGPNPEEEYREAELRDRVRQFAEELSPSLRRAFQLRDFDGLTTGEAAQMLGVTDGTVKSQVARARAKLTRVMCCALDVQPRASRTCTSLRVAKGK